MPEHSTTKGSLLKTSLVHMKGQAVPLFSYHIIRDLILKHIAGEHQSSILYWAGKDLAHQFEIKTYEECKEIVLELGWGTLVIDQDRTRRKRLQLHSPFFVPRHVDQNHSTFALECGFLTEIVSHIEQKTASGNFKVASDSTDLFVDFTIYLEEKEGTAST